MNDKLHVLLYKFGIYKTQKHLLNNMEIISFTHDIHVFDARCMKYT